MTTFFLTLLSTTALVLCSIRDDTHEARARRQAWSSLSFGRGLWLVVQAIAGVALVLVFAALRTSLYSAFAGVAAGCAWLASVIAMERHRLRTVRLEVL